jgi:16S rRNA processing protein RimM|tara:strand:+ start:43 stop:546 length:504 start_codon:yes stop_codon:yes gene_type:complete
MSYDNHIIVGKILTTHGIKGWFTIGSYTSNPEDIFKYNLKVVVDNKFTQLTVTEYNFMPKKIIMKLENIDAIESCNKYMNLDLYTLIDELPEVESNEYYWHDLVGCTVFNENSVLLGVADSLFTSGDTDILVVKRDNSQKEILIPFLKSNIVSVKNSKIIVRWNSEI